MIVSWPSCLAAATSAAIESARARPAEAHAAAAAQAKTTALLIRVRIIGTSLALSLSAGLPTALAFRSLTLRMLRLHYKHCDLPHIRARLCPTSLSQRATALDHAASACPRPWAAQGYVERIDPRGQWRAF